MRKIYSPFNLIQYLEPFDRKVMVDIGCGTGELVRLLASHGAKVTGIDTKKMIDRAKKLSESGSERYMTGKAEKLHFDDNSVDVVIYCASFHHIPEFKMQEAIDECLRILRQGGTAVFIEPVVRSGSYYEITGLVEDEKAMYLKAYGIIKSNVNNQFIMKKESFAYMERSFEDYIKLLNTFVDDRKSRKGLIEKARIITGGFCNRAKISFEDFRYKSIVRLNILEKTGEKGISL